MLGHDLSPPTSLTRRDALKLGGAAIAGASVSAFGQTQPWPQRPVKLLVGFSAGGAPDLIARDLAAGLTEIWGQPVIVENRTGAGGSLAADATAKATPDGHTLLLASDSALVVVPLIQDKPLYDPLTDFRLTGIVATLSLVLVTTPGAQLDSYKALVAAAKAKPGGISYGSVGVGTSLHIAMLRLQKALDIQLNHIPYRGSPPAVQDLLGGSIQVMWGPLATAVPHIEAGRMIPLAVSSVERQVKLPNVPTVIELGVPAFEAGNWFGIAAPAKIPDAIAKKIEADAFVVAQSARFKERMRAAGAEARAINAAEFEKRVRVEYERNKALLVPGMKN